MAKMPTDANAKPIPALRPFATEVVSGSSAPMVSDIIRLVADSAASYGLDGATDVPLPAGVVEYIRVVPGEILTTAGTITVSQMG